MTDACPDCGAPTPPLVSDVDGSTEHVCPEHGSTTGPRNDFAALVGVAVKRVDYVPPDEDDPDAGYCMIEFADGATLYADAPSLYGAPAAAEAKCSCEVKGIPGFGPHLPSCPLYEGTPK